MRKDQESQEGLLVSEEDSARQPNFHDRGVSTAMSHVLHLCQVGLAQQNLRLTQIWYL